MVVDTQYSRSFGMCDKVGYALGDLANCLTFTLCSTFFLKFYNEVVGVDAAIIGMFMMVCKFFDAFTDVAMGQIVDRSHPTKKGKFAPWMLRFSGPVALACFLMFGVWVKDWPMAGKIFWMIFTYILYGSICYTGVNIPYGGMANAISSSPKDRTELSNYRAIGSTIGGTVIGVVLPIIAFDKIKGSQVLKGDVVMWLSLGFSALAFILYLVCYGLTTERVKIYKKPEKFSLIKIFKTWFTSKSVLILIIATIIYITSTTYADTLKGYVFPNVLGSNDAWWICNLINLAITLVFAFVMVRFTNILGRKTLMVGGAFFSAIMFAVLAIMQTRNLIAYIVIFSFVMIGYAFMNLVCWAMVGDVIDDAELKNNKREDGSIYGAYSFSRKMGQALASGISGLLLQVVGVKAGETPTDPTVLKGIYNISTIIPAVLFAITGALFLFLYPLGKNKVLENTKTLKEVRTANEKNHPQK